MIEPCPSDRGLLISHLHDQFWSDEYYRAAQAVRHWKAERRADWAEALFEALDRVDRLPLDERKAVVQTNAGRRLVKSYFRKTQQLCARGLLEPADLREHLTMPQRLRTLFEIIEPFELARTPDYDREMFDFYGELHGGELERPARSL